MTQLAPISSPVVRRAAFVVNKERRRQFVEVLDYIKALHYHIDPDMYRIDLEMVAALERLFRDEEEEEDSAEAMCLAFTYHELLALGCFIDAADTYCHRSSMKRDDLRLTDQQLTALSDWVTRAERWFVTPVRES